jgi:hypothetical protein
MRGSGDGDRRCQGRADGLRRWTEAVAQPAATSFGVRIVQCEGCRLAAARMYPRGVEGASASASDTGGPGGPALWPMLESTQGAHAGTTA